ncbi:ABC transporter substrate-binding protein [Amycolatopsis carbonis]|uniref:ABC transporter substrate-binding protein n=1 Tax=Amycolatopsis carbonis TaxID=715471 RepID=A0A9Y2IHE9_9PSEU|nr:ABC transporter substrate-binding protein [Amycolatopsis sp. 2-15]WIX77113.1 ABC transporter substrate-binding protein [Amycolatopsis sp. 2-15]WIX79200.1 ABC transporter substrate-binding protein [Amycolatopsis sp. 2-15]
MSRLNLTFACGDYDRTRALEDGSIRPDGIDLTYLRLPVEETFFRMLRHGEFDASEMSLSTYVASLDRDPAPFVALPVFTSRMFRHGGIFINTAAGIEKPADLVGKRIGTPEFQLTAGVWIRGILADAYDVPLDSVTYLTGGQETPGRIEKGAVSTRFDVQPIPADRTLSDLLATGEIDALQSPRIPSSYVAGDGRVARLFPDTVAAEKEYYAETGIFPIMHVVALRREVYERHPWVAQSLTKAFTAAKKEAYARIYDASALRFMEPWLNQHLEDARSLLGPDYWSYGLNANRHVLDVFLRYHHEQGLSARLRTAEELFAPESTESFVI